VFFIALHRDHHVAFSGAPDSEGSASLFVIGSHATVLLTYHFESFGLFIRVLAVDPHSALCSSCSRKRKEAEPRTKCLLNNADMTPHHPTDPVEMRRINFQTPGTEPSETGPHTCTVEDTHIYQTGERGRGVCSSSSLCVSQQLKKLLPPHGEHWLFCPSNCVHPYGVFTPDASKFRRASRLHAKSMHSCVEAA